MIKKIFSVKKIMLFVFLFVGCMLFVSCGEEKNDKVASSIDIVGNINSEYGLGVDIDLTNVFVQIGYSDNTSEKFSLTSSKVTADKFDTATVGEKEVEVSCEGLTTKIKYNVVEYTLTLKFLDGTYEELNEKRVGVYNNFVDVKEIVPVPNDNTMQFAGWFYDEELTKRVETNIEGEYIVNKDTIFYAGYDKNYDDIFKYEITDNGEVILTHYDYSSDVNFGDIVIPKTIKLYPVVSIDDNFIDLEGVSFLWWKDGLTFEEGSQVKYIGDYAFYGLSISNVNFPTTLEKIGNYAFYNCGLTSVTFPKSLRIIGDYAFADSYELMTVDFNDSNLVNIGNHAFDYLSKLVNVTLSDKVETIGSYAFANCSKLTEFYVSKSVISIGINTFASLPNLNKISVSEENKYFSSVDGNLYNKDKTVFYRYCYGKTEEEFSLPDTVKTIYESAFDIKNEISSLKKINLNEGLIEISSKAFANTTVEFVLPESLKTLALDAFYDWNGKEFVVNENNKYFKVLDSCLVSFDLETLYAVPCGYEKESFQVPDSIKTITSYAICDLTNVKYIKISKDSELAMVNEFGFMPFTIKNLIAVIIEKSQAFDIVSNSFNDYSTFVNTSFSLIIDSNNIDGYKEKWQNYGIDDDEKYIINNYIVTPEEFCTNTLSAIENSLNITTFKIFEELGVFEIDNDFLSYYLNAEAVINKLIIIASFNEEIYSLYDSYFYKFVRNFYLTAINFFNSISDTDFYSNNRIFDDLYKNYSLFPSNIINRINENDDINKEIKEIKNKYDTLYEKQAEVINDLMKFKLSRTEFDYDSYKEIMARYERYGAEKYKVSNNQLERIFKLECAFKVYEFLNTKCTYDNIIHLYELYYGNDFEGLYGISQYLENYFKHESARADIYGLDLLEERVAVIDEYLNELVAHINKYFADFVEPVVYNEDDYQEAMKLYNHISDYTYLLDPLTTEKYQQMYIRMLINKFNKIIDENGVTKENISELVPLFNDISNNFGSYVFSLNEYEKLTANIDLYNDGFDNISSEFTTVLFQIDSDNILDLFPTLEEKYNEMHDFLDLLIIVYDGNWVNLTSYYNAVSCAYRVYKAINLGSSENYQENYSDLFKCIFGYYDYESSISYLSINEIINNNAFNNDFNMIYSNFVDETVLTNYNKVCEKI